MNKTYLYPYSSAEARERNELSLWRESHRANIACRDAIEDGQLQRAWQVPPDLPLSAANE